MRRIMHHAMTMASVRINHVNTIITGKAVISPVIIIRVITIVRAVTTTDITIRAMAATSPDITNQLPRQ